MFHRFARSIAPLALLALSLTTAPALLAQEVPTTPTTKEAIDPAAFLGVAAEALQAREDRLLSIEDFLVLSGRPEAIILDTRSAANFSELHLDGAVNLNFSELTKRSLLQVVGDPDRPIFIYCNNNFTDDEEPFVTKLPPAALNLPTYATLWAYGYHNVYELGDLLDIGDERLTFQGSAATALRASATTSSALSAANAEKGPEALRLLR